MKRDLDFDSTVRRVRLAAALLGLGAGGLFDAIVLRGILEWHSFQIGRIGEGAVALVALVLAGAGVTLLWRAMHSTQARLSTRILPGGVLAGWGIYHLVEAMTMHQVLALHNSPRGPFVDGGMLILGGALMLLGYLIGRDSQARPLKYVMAPPPATFFMPPAPRPPMSRLDWN
jgi:uncharacterized membrane protein